jgi:GNAT superfamily N-acetyltransferase
VADVLRIIASTDLAPGELGAFYDEILAPAFDSAELVERAELLADLADDGSVTRGAIAYDEAGLVIGGIVGDWFAESRVMLISYLAARRGLRGHGIGRRLLGEVLPIWTSTFGALLSVAEVEIRSSTTATKIVATPRRGFAFTRGWARKLLLSRTFSQRSARSNRGCGTCS